MLVSRRELTQELQEHARKFLLENFGLYLTIPIHINSRLRATGGRFRYYRKGNGSPIRAKDIEIAKFVCENGTKEEILDILEHECIHYALFEQSLPHGDKDSYFINTCKRLNVGLNHRIVKERHDYICPKCENLTDHYRKIPKGYYMTCEHCGSKIRQENLARITSMRVRQVI